MICVECNSEMTFDQLGEGATCRCENCGYRVVLGKRYRIAKHEQRDATKHNVTHSLIDNAVCYIDDDTFVKGEGAVFYYEARFDPANPLHTLSTSDVEDIEWGDQGTLTVLTKNTEYVFEPLS